MYILSDQKAIWTSPFHTSKRDAKWWLIFGGATGALIAADKYVSKNAPDPAWLQHLGNHASDLGQPYVLLPMATGFYLAGTKLGNDRFREAGLLSFEAVADVAVVEFALKSLFDRQRPYDAQGNGQFEASTGARYNSSFPSGHTIVTFAMASVVAHVYHDKLWVKLLAYSYAGGVAGARLAANKHFPGDVMAGAAIGWFVGDYVYSKRHNPELEQKPGVTAKILDHIRIGGAYPTVPSSPVPLGMGPHYGM
jgi:membrane-associated phospholipid phosphatase